MDRRVSPSESQQTSDQVIASVLRRLEFYFPGDPSATGVAGAVRSGAAGPTELQRLFRALVDEGGKPAPEPHVPPYDAELDEALSLRGWRSRRDEGWDSHTFDMWTWPPSQRYAQPTVIHHEGHQLRVFYAISPILARAPHVVFENRSQLLDQIDYIEAWS